MKRFVLPQRTTALLAAALLSASAAPGAEVTLQDPSLAVSFDAASGALTRLENLSTHWVMEQRPELGVSFRLTVLTPDNREIGVLGWKQPAAEVKRLSAGQLRL